MGFFARLEGLGVCHGSLEGLCIGLLLLRVARVSRRAGARAKIPTRFLNGNPDLGWGRACPYIRGASISSLYISRLLAYI